MLNKICLVTIFAFVILGCSLTEKLKEDAPVAEKPVAEDAAAATPKKGDKVVALWSAKSYYDGVIEEIGSDNSKMTIKWDDGSSLTEVESSNVFPRPKDDAKPKVEVGDIVLAKEQDSTRWDGAKISAVNGSDFVVKLLAGGSEKTLKGNEIIKLPASNAEVLKDSEASNEFLEKAHAKNPTPPENYKPRKGDMVLALWSTNSWWSGKVEAVKDDKITVAWEDGSSPSDIDINKVMPLPNASNTKLPEKEQYVLAKPESGTKWEYAQAVSVEDNAVTVKDANNKERKLKAGEVVPLN
ncbi:MAG: DUF4537 domain-containing protein [Acidobacteria bacterium]|nr:DUF4537 domain-containing protein [Acidobacteriota bacterium]